MENITDHLVAFTQAHPPEAALAIMRLSVFDWLACGSAGLAEGAFLPFRDGVLAEAGKGNAQVFGGARAPTSVAALLNGTLSHALDYDDTHFAHIGHPSVAVVPAALAVGEAQGATLSQIITAALIGAEASVHVGIWLGRQHYQIGYHQTATAGAFGATLAAARLMQLEPGQTRHALGLCASIASGLKAQFGTMGKPLNAGLAARTGVEAAQWAALGLTAAQDGLAGPLGFGDTHHGAGDTTALANLGQGRWQMENVSHKFHACCHGLHAMLEALRDVDIAADNVTRIEVHTHPRWMSVCNQLNPATGLASKFSYRHTAAMQISGFDTGQIANFTDANANDTGLVKLRSRVFVAADEGLSEMQSRVLVTDAAERIHEVYHDLAAPISIDLRTQKLRNKAKALLGPDAAQAAWSAVQDDELAHFLSCMA